ncbi:hypothetical protein DN730_05325 [Marinomonas piezotolerans]|uniref:Uncharacterized protein n=1 Tax=Marinomonas piezotolerans TaxID=2213058 RepID=A0A370UB65_9GAMM|nr:hypothetical protein [Marinomonas piezotolerans]RDL45040.1 hypothetical protein DN730_05325 [Marinomonas piezotolerans]
MDKISVKGNQNITVGRDLIIDIDEIKRSDFKLYKVIDNKLNSIDEFVGRYVTGVQSHTKKDPEPFRSSIIIESMGKIGIPIGVAIQAVGDASNKVVSQKNEQETVVKSSFVRKCVTESLYSLDGDRWEDYEIEAWAESYIRRYGTETIIKVVGDPEGNELVEKDLAISYFLDVVIPDVYRLIMKDAGIQISCAPLKKVASKSMQRRMAEKIIDAVHALDLYRIHYSVLIALSKEMALQPPHPWFSPTVREFQTVNYHYERYKLNNRKAKAAQEVSDYGALYYSIKEVVEHSCAAIMGYYSIYMGCGPLSSFYVLQSVVRDICRGEESDSCIIFRLEELKADLKRSEIEEEQFAALLRRIRKRIESTKKKEVLELESLYIDAEELAHITTTLIASFIRVEKEKKLRKERKDLTLSDIFLGFPFLEWEWHVSQEAFWITHHYDTPCFSNIKPKILIVPIVDDEGVNQKINAWLTEAGKFKIACNAIFFISKNIIDIENKLNSTSHEINLNLVSITENELLQAAFISNPWDILEKIIFERCRTV